MKVNTFFVIGISLVFLLFSAFVPHRAPDRANNTFVVVLDAGHGGHDPGNLGNGYLEKNIALGIVLAAGKALESHPDIKVVYTRKDDRFVDLYVRGEVANKAKADLFVSVHCDSHSSDASGAGTFVLGLHANKQNFEIAKKENSVIYLEDNYESRYAAYDINSPESIIGLTIMQEEFLDQSILLGKMMQDNFTTKLKRKDRKVKQAGFIVLHQTFMPSVLVETGFLTNKNEGSYLNSRKGQSEMGQAIADAIVLYKTNLWSESTAFEEPGENVITSVPEVAPEAQQEVMPDAKDSEDVKTDSASVPQEKNQQTDSEVVAVAVTDRILTDKPSAQIKQAKSEEEIAMVEKELKTAEVPDELTNKDESGNKPTEKTAAEISDEAIKSLEESPTKDLDKVDAVAETPEVSETAVEETAKQPAKDDSMNTATVDEPSESTKKTSASPITFKVQILASSKQIPLKSENFKGLSTISKEPYKNLFRYMYGRTDSYEQAKMLKSNADLKGYSTSFIVAYREGVRIPLKEAMKYVSE